MAPSPAWSKKLKISLLSWFQQREVMSGTKTTRAGKPFQQEQHPYARGLEEVGVVNEPRCRGVKEREVLAKRACFAAGLFCQKMRNLRAMLHATGELTSLFEAHFCSTMALILSKSARLAMAITSVRIAEIESPIFKKYLTPHCT